MNHSNSLHGELQVVPFGSQAQQQEYMAYAMLDWPSASAHGQVSSSFRLFVGVFLYLARVSKVSPVPAVPHAF